MTRRFVGLIVAAIGTAAPMIFGLLIFPPQGGGVGVPMIATGSASLGIWLIGGSAYGWWRPTIRLGEWLVLGALFGLLLSAAAISLTALLRHALDPAEHPLAAILAKLGTSDLVGFGLFELPCGLFGGWLFWRIAKPTSDSELVRRQWQSLRMPRLIGALALAAAVLWGVAIAASILLNDRLTALELAAVLMVGLIAAEIWFLPLGLAYLVAVGRRRGGILRRDCLFLGTLLTCLFPMGLVVLGYVFLPAADIGQSPAEQLREGSFMVVVLGALLVPFGLFSGWIIWRVGVRPAPAPASLVDPAAVFD